MKTDLGKLLDDMVDGYTPSPTPQDEINAKVSELENKLTDMIESKLSNINISQETPQPTENDPDEINSNNERKEDN